MVIISVNSISTLLGLDLLAIFQDAPGMLQDQTTVCRAFVKAWFSLLCSLLLCRHKGFFHVQMTHCLEYFSLFKLLFNSRIEVKCYFITGIGVQFTERLFPLQIDEHRICVCVRKRPLNKKGMTIKPLKILLVFWGGIFVGYFFFPL